MYPKKLLFFYKKGTYVITFEIPFNFSTAVFGEGFADHVPLFGSLAVFALLLFETRLFCHSFITEKRVRLLERNFIAPMFDTQVKVEPDWDGVLSGSYIKTPELPFLPSIASPLKSFVTDGLCLKIFGKKRDYFVLNHRLKL